jgi:hypothetical protein
VNIEPTDQSKADDEAGATDEPGAIDGSGSRDQPSSRDRTGPAAGGRGVGRYCRARWRWRVAWTLVAGLLTGLAVRVVAELTAVDAAVRRRLDMMRADREAGLTTVEVAVLTAVLLGLATAATAAITIVVNRNTAKIK